MEKLLPLSQLTTSGRTIRVENSKDLNLFVVECKHLDFNFQLCFQYSSIGSKAVEFDIKQDYSDGTCSTITQLKNRIGSDIF